MAEPRSLTIIKEVASRLEQITIANGYNLDFKGNVRRGYPGEILTLDMAPVIFVFSDIANLADTKSLGIIVASGFTVEAAMVPDLDNMPEELVEAPEDMVHLAFADIHRAIEQPWDAVRQQDEIIGKYQFESDEPVRSREQSNIIGVRVNYSFTYRRNYGEV